MESTINKNSTLDDFIKLGLEKTKEAISAYIGTPISFETIEKAHEWWKEFHQKFLLIDKDAPEFFTSSMSAYIFYLTKLEGKQRNKMLGISEDLYGNSDKAKNWYRNISKIVHPDVYNCNDPDGIAFKELKKLYDVMIENYDEGENGSDE